LFVLWENSKIFDLILISTPTILFPFILILCCPNKFQFPFLFSYNPFVKKKKRRERGPPIQNWTG
jgi:hypothetical protein